MKKHLRIVIAGLCLLAGLVWWLWPSSPLPKIAPAIVAPSPQPDTQPPVAATSPSQTAPPPASDSRGKEEVMSEKLGILNDQPIEFYGKVIDQRDEPVGGAKVRAGVMVEKMWMAGKIVDYYTTTDGAGNFAFRGMRGARMLIQPGKEGYEFKADNNRNFNYSLLNRESERHHPDSSRPEVFKLWKLKGAEPLVHSEINRVGVPVDGTPVAFDLLKGRKTPEDGDLIVTIERSPIHIKRGQKFDWKATIEVPGGGLIELDDPYANEAPIEGYEGKVVINMQSASPQWQSSAFHRYYINSRGGKIYGRLTLDITANYEPPPTGVTLEAWLNPSGSRNLEYDPRK
jgi:hypothetical protein